MSQKSLTNLEAECASLLRVPSHLPETKRRGLMNSRLHALGHSDPCGRCGGCGKYSFNQVDGSRCYGCGGIGGKAPKVTRALLTAVEASVGAGALDAYLLKLRTLQAAQKAQQRVMDAWQATGVSKTYNWMKAANGGEPDRTIANEINRPMCEAYERIKEMGSELSSLAFQLTKVTTVEEKARIEEERLALARRIQEDAGEAIALINRLAAQIPEILRTNRHASVDDGPSP